MKYVKIKATGISTEDYILIFIYRIVRSKTLHFAIADSFHKIFMILTIYQLTVIYCD